MYLEQLITDRSEADLVNDTDRAYISYEDLNRIEKACLELAEITGAAITTKEWTINDYRTVSEMKRLRDNLILLKESYYPAPDTPDTPEEITYTTIGEANDVEKIISDIWVTYKTVLASAPRLSFKLGMRKFGNGEV